jgi:Cu+-exporting ATPase
MLYDPVCGMEVDPAEAPATARFEGEMYYFCSEDCYQEFMADPEDFAGESARPDLP